MNYSVRTVNSIRESKFTSLDAAMNWATNHGNSIVYDCINNSMIAATHKVDGEVYITRLFNGRMLQVNAMLARQRELGNVPRLKGDTTLEQLGWQDIS
jgi:hypothetical protein